MNPTTSQSSKTSSTPAASSLRPRNRRLPSGLDDESEPSIGSGLSNHKVSPFASPFNSRAASPIPSTNPSRADSSRTAPRSNLSGIGSSVGIFGQGSSQESAGFSGLLGNSWSAIQGLASNVLGSDTSSDGKQSRRRRPLQATHRRTASSAPPKQWGPSASSGPQIGAGSQEERENMVRALKRRDLLAADGNIYPDAVGRIKRRNSDERLSLSAPPGEQDDRDALVYVHRVRPEDTLAGITIRYNCQAAVLRKANRMWPNDTVQTRKTIVLPVDACGVKGRPVPDPTAHVEDDLLLGGYGDSTADNERTPTQTPTLTNGWHTSSAQITSAPRPTSSSTSHADSEPPWKHESWVFLPNDTNPTEVARLPRRTLGFFPPARRKSLTFSDTPTASSSFDLPRSSLSTASSHAHSPSLASIKGGSSTTITPITSNSPPPRTRNRTSSMSQFHLHGPGGVGTMGKNVRSPGPAQDGLNKLFASHLPNVAPPPGQEYFTPWNPGLLDLDAGLDGSNAVNSFQTANSGGRVAGGGGIDLENMGGAIESWMRKMAKGASTMLEPSNKNVAGRGSAVPIIGVVGGDMGDLIELRDDAFEVGGDDDDEDDLGRGRRTTESLGAPSGSGLYGSGRADPGAAVRDRGRGRSGGTKTD